MKIKFVYYVLPAIVRYADGGSYGGIARLIYIQIQKKYRHDNGLLVHELTHVEQFYRLAPLAILGFLSYVFGLSAALSIVVGMVGLVSHSLLYLALPSFRYRMEIEAFRAQLSAYPSAAIDRELAIEKMVDIITTRYGLSVAREKARLDLSA